MCVHVCGTKGHIGDSDSDDTTFSHTSAFIIISVFVLNKRLSADHDVYFLTKRPTQAMSRFHDDDDVDAQS